MKIKIGTRGSKLAIWQAKFVLEEILKKSPENELEIVKISTKGDKILDAPLSKIGGKGLFTKEIEEKLQDGTIDIAVHSLKDVPNEIDKNFEIGAVTRRESPFDAFLSNKYEKFEEMPKKAVIGTSSVRRAAQIKILRSDVEIKNLRGNVETRLKKLDFGEFDGIILSAAGLERLGYGSRIKEILTKIVPAAGQGAIAVEIRSGDEKISKLVKKINDEETFIATKIERDFLKKIGGSCQIPAGIFAEVKNEKILVCGIISSFDGKKYVKSTFEEKISDFDKLGEKIAEKLLMDGGEEILRKNAEVIENANKNTE